MGNASTWRHDDYAPTPTPVGKTGPQPPTTNTPAVLPTAPQVPVTHQSSYSSVKPLDTLLLLVVRAEKGEIRLHTKIDESKLSFAENDVLGRGASGTVFKGTYRGEPVAVKKVKLTGMDDRDWKYLRREVAIMSLVSHPNVVSCRAANISKKKNEFGTLIVKLFERGTLEDLMKKELTKWGIKRFLAIAKDVADGMFYLASCGIIHRDLKPANVLVDSNYCAMISDYGISRPINFSGADMGMTLGVGTPIYMAPELLKEGNKSYANEVDVYSFGIILWQLVTKREPYTDFRGAIFDFVREIVGGMRPPIDQNKVDPKLAELIAKCWNDQSLARPAFNEVSKKLGEYIIDLE